MSARPAKGRKGRKGNTPRSDFTARVLTTVRRIPAGRVATYGDVAALAGKPRAARAGGNIMRDCRRADVPRHRVIASGGPPGRHWGPAVPERIPPHPRGGAESGGRG